VEKNLGVLESNGPHMRGLGLLNLSIGSLVVFPKTTTYPKKRIEKKRKKKRP
jgi:hypothetical protein